MLRPLGIPRSPQAPHRQTCSHCLSLAESGALFGVRQNLDPTPERGKSPSWAIILQEQQEHPGTDLLHSLFSTPWPGKVVLQTLSGTQSEWSPSTWG